MTAATLNQTRYRTIFDAMLEGMVFAEVILDAQGLFYDARILEVNPAFGRITGLKCEEVIGRTIRQLNFVAPPRLPNYQRVLATGEPDVAELLGPPCGKWVRVSLVRPDPRHIAMLFQDISQERAALQSAQLAGERFRQAFENLSDRALLLDTDRRVLYANRAALAGRALSDVTGQEVTHVWPALDSPEWRSGLDDVLRTGRSWLNEALVLASDHGDRWYRRELTPILDANGTVAEVAFTARDTHAEHEAAAALSQRLALAERFEQVGRSVPGVICSLRLAPDGQVSMPFATPFVEEHYGFTAAELASDFRPVIDRYHPDDAAELTRSIAVSAEGLTPWHGQFRYLHPTRGLRHLEGWSQPCREPDGGTVWHGFVMDVTERERERQLLREREEQLRVAQRMEAVGRIAGGVAHDFNNLLTVIQSSTDMALRALSGNEEVQKDLVEVVAAAGRAAALTAQLLAFSRKQVLNPRVIDLNALCERSLTMLRRVLGEHVELNFRPEPQLAATLADPGQIEQVVMNLCINARDAMPHGGRITVETANVNLDDLYCATHADAQPGPHVMLAVSDTGVGMDQATQAKIFEPFFTTKPVGQGTGLGLATCHGIVNQSGGSIRVYSELGVGTTFKVYLPRVGAPVVADAPRQPGRRPTGNEVLLVVEDEEAVRRIIAKILRPLGYEVLLATSPNDALGVVGARADLSLLITDVVMPGMSGRELADRARAIHAELSVLYISGYTANTIDHHGVLDAGLEFLSKPFTVEALAAKVREVLDLRRKSQPS